MKKAVFSNGHEVVYKGRRNVKVAWMAVLPNGKIITGFSLDMAKAEKTSKNNATILCDIPNSNLLGFGFRGTVPSYFIKAREEEARRRGFKNFEEWKKYASNATSKWLNDTQFEFVKLA